MVSITAQVRSGGSPNQVCLNLSDGARTRTLIWSVSMSGRASSIAETTLWSGLRQYAIAQAEAMILSGTAFEDSVALMIQVDEDDLDEVIALGTNPSCKYRIDQDGDPYCVAASPKDETRLGTSGLRVLAPTSRRLCQTCAMPPSTLVCHHMRHPQVVGLRASGTTLHRDLVEADCDLGNREVGIPGKCQPYGNDCWEKQVEIAVRGRVDALHPLALPEAIDFLDAVYRLRFKQYLLAHVPAVTLGALAQPVSTRDDFKSRASDLVAVVEAFTIDGPPDEIRGSLNRLERLLAAEEIEIDPNAIGALRHIVNVRNAMQHPGKAKDLARHLSAIGAEVPVLSWAGAWATVEGAAIASLRTLRDSLRSSS